MLVRLVKNGEGMEFPVMEFGSRPSCATCKWAEVVDAGARFPLACKKIDSASRRDAKHSQPTHDDALAWAVDMEGWYGTNLRVAPDFGCTQWEGK